MALDLSFPPSLAPTPALSVTSDPLDRKRSYTVGTRKSALALIQTQLIATHLKKTHSNLDFPVHSSSTLGDRNQTTPLHLLSPYTSSQPAKSLWTDELELLLAAGQFDMIVHSLKDVPTTLKEGFELGCCFKREDPRDAVVMREGSKYKGLGELPAGSVVGTGSVRRVAQLKRAYPNLRFEDMRGNLNTRLSKLDSPTSHFSALILAIAGMTRLGQAHRITAPLSSPVLMHAVGQGALGVEIRHGDRDTRQLLRQIGHWETEWRCAAERGLLRVLEGGCSVPVGVETTLVELKPKLRTQPSSSGGPSGVNGHDESAAHGHNAGYAESSFEPLNGDSPILHLSGLLPLTQPLPPASMSADELAQYLAPRKAVLKLSASVTSLDGTTHVVYDAPEQVVSSWRSAQAWGEECARKLKEMGAGEVLDVINEQRRAREAEDVERARKVREEEERKRRENGEERIEGYNEGNVPAATAATA